MYILQLVLGSNSLWFFLWIWFMFGLCWIDCEVIWQSTGAPRLDPRVRGPRGLSWSDCWANVGAKSMVSPMFSHHFTSFSLLSYYYHHVLYIYIYVPFGDRGIPSGFAILFSLITVWWMQAIATQYHQVSIINGCDGNHPKIFLGFLLAASPCLCWLVVWKSWPMPTLSHYKSIRKIPLLRVDLEL